MHLGALERYDIILIVRSSMAHKQNTFHFESYFSAGTSFLVLINVFFLIVNGRFSKG